MRGLWRRKLALDRGGSDGGRYRQFGDWQFGGVGANRPADCDLSISLSEQHHHRHHSGEGLRRGERPESQADRVWHRRRAVGGIGQRRNPSAQHEPIPVAEDACRWRSHSDGRHATAHERIASSDPQSGREGICRSERAILRRAGGVRRIRLSENLRPQHRLRFDEGRPGHRCEHCPFTARSSRRTASTRL